MSTPARFAVAFGLVVAAGALVVAASKILLLLFAGALWGLLLSTVTRWVARVAHLPRTAALALVVTLWLGAVVVSVLLAAPSLSDQIDQLQEQLPRALDGVLRRLRHEPIVEHTLGPAAPEAKLRSPVPPERVVNVALGALGGTVEVLGGSAVVFFVGVYGAAQPRVHEHAILSVTPPAWRRRVGRAVRASTRTLARWMVGRLIAMVFVGVTTSIVFALLHIPLAMTLGIVAGLLTFIEYIGAVLSAIPPTVLAAAESPGKALGVLALFTAIHVVEGYVLTPMLVRATVRLPPALTLALQVVLGTLVGPLGLTLSTPLFVIAVASTKACRSSEGHPLHARGLKPEA